MTDRNGIEQSARSHLSIGLQQKVKRTRGHLKNRENKKEYDAPSLLAFTPWFPPLSFSILLLYRTMEGSFLVASPSGTLFLKKERERERGGKETVFLLPLHLNSLSLSLLFDPYHPPPKLPFSPSSVAATIFSYCLLWLPFILYVDAIFECRRYVHLFRGEDRIMYRQNGTELLYYHIQYWVSRGIKRVSFLSSHSISTS